MNFIILAESISWGEKLNYIGTGTLLGLGVVFAVLILLWGILALFHFCFSKLTGKKTAPQPEVAPEPAPAPEAESEDTDEGELIAAITAAVSVYLEQPQTGFRVVTFKKVGHNAHWNQN